MTPPITLSDGIAAIELPPDMFWADESDWSPVEAGSDEYSLDGSLHIDPFVKKAGRPITLRGDDDFAWVKWRNVLDLQTWAADPAKEMTLTMPDGRTFTVRFNYAISNPVQATPVLMLNPPHPDDDYYITLSLIEV